MWPKLTTHTIQSYTIHHKEKPIKKKNISSTPCKSPWPQNIRKDIPLFKPKLLPTKNKNKTKVPNIS